MIGIHKNIKSASKTTKEIPFAGSFLGLALAKKIIELVNSLNKGVYSISFIVNGNVVSTQKLTIVK